LRKCVLVMLAPVLVLGLVACRPDQQMAPTVAKSVSDNYSGSEVCGGCHSSIYNQFVESGHPYTLTEVANGQKPIGLPFSTLPNLPGTGMRDGDNTLGPPASYADVSYVIGGYYWKALFIDLNGYIITGADVQYNVANHRWAPFFNGVVDKPYDCGSCHTTGWVPATSTATRKESLPGMGGNFYAGGVQCEACHGPGAAHVNTSGDKRYITKNTASSMCGKCHTRQDGNRIVADNGFISHHGQYDELLGLNPDNMGAGGMGKHLANGVGCNTCHNPHATTVNRHQTGSNGVVKECVECHPDRVIASGTAHSQENLANNGLLDQPSGKKITNCVACHMPKLTLSAVTTAKAGSGPYIGDIRTHIFKINLAKAEQFTADGKFSYPWTTAQYSCKQCHNGVYFFELPVPVSYQVHRRRT